MKASIPLLSFFLLVFPSCEENKTNIEDTNSSPPSISIVSPTNNSTVNDTVFINCESIDDIEVARVELWVDDDSTGVADSSAPYILPWVTNNYKNGIHTLFVRSYDNTGNNADSEIITLSVDNFLVFYTTFGYVGINDAGFSIVQAADSSYIILGSTGNDILLLKADRKGAEQWSRVFGGSQFDEARHIQQTSDGGYIISGTTKSYGFGGSDIWLIKTDPSGLIEWNTYFGGTHNEHGGQVLQTSDGGFILIGDRDFSGDGSLDIWLIRTNSLGDSLWTKTFGGENIDQGSDIISFENGGFMLLGSTTSYGNGGADIWIIKTDSNGNEEWNHSYGGGSDDYGQSILQTSDGGYIIRSVIESFGDGNTAVGLLRISSTGDEVWSKTFGGSGGAGGNALRETYEGGYILVCNYYNHGNSAFDTWLIKINPSGNLLWDKTFGGINHDYGFSVLQTFDGGFALAGSTYNLGNGDANYSDLWLIKTDPEGNTVSFSE